MFYTSQTYVAYYRVSTDRQGKSGLAFEAQRLVLPATWRAGAIWSRSIPRKRAAAKTTARS